MGSGVMARAANAGVDGGGSGTGPRTSSTAVLVDSDPEDYDDDATYSATTGKRVQTVDLYDIGQEGEMAPLVLPRDEKKWNEEEALRQEHERATRRMRGIKSPKKDKQQELPDVKEEEEEGGVRATAAAAEADEDLHNKVTPDVAKMRVKMDPYEEEEMAASSLAGTPGESNGSTPVPLSRAPTVDGSQDRAVESTAAAAAAAAPRAEDPVDNDAVLGAEDVKVKVKKEDISVFFNLPKEAASSEQFYVFQFPRLFPKFYDANDPMTYPPGMLGGGDGEETKPDVKPDGSILAAALNGSAGSAAGNGPLVDPFSLSKHKVKSSLHESESDAWRDYSPGKWQGWGRNTGRDDREYIMGGEVEKGLSGKIGKIRVRRSGKTTLKMGDIEYEVGRLQRDAKPWASCLQISHTRNSHCSDSIAPGALCTL